MTENEFKIRTENLALALIRFVEGLPKNEACRVLGRQLLRSGTSVAANYRAACRARSDADFVNKLGIVEEEADESLLWLRLLERSGHAKPLHVEALYLEMESVLKMIVASIKTKRYLGNPKSAMLTDTHAHLASRQFADDLPQVMSRARDAGVKRIICVSTNLDDAPAVLKIAETYEDVFATVGIHPCDADTAADKPFVSMIRELAAHPKVVGIGEIGLDYFHQPPDGYTVETWKAQQASVLQEQLELAAELGLNVVLHNRESFADLSAQVKPFNGRLRAVFHCFTGSHEDAMPLIEQGHLVSFTGIVTFKNGQVIQECARAVPDGSFMLETDCPYLAPMPHRGQRNEPAYVAHTAAFVARLRGADTERITRVTGETAAKFFRRLD